MFKAINDDGNSFSGEIEADSEQMALELLSRQGNIPESVKKKPPMLSGGGCLIVSKTLTTEYIQQN